jgi:hypothetical protein
MPEQIAAAAAMARIAETLSSLFMCPPAGMSPSLPTIPPELLLRIMGSGMEEEEEEEEEELLLLLLLPHAVLFLPPPPLMHSPALPANASDALNLCRRSAGTPPSKEL